MAEFDRNVCKQARKMVISKLKNNIEKSIIDKKFPWANICHAKDKNDDIKLLTRLIYFWYWGQVVHNKCYDLQF